MPCPPGGTLWALTCCHSQPMSQSTCCPSPIIIFSATLGPQAQRRCLPACLPGGYLALVASPCQASGASHILDGQTGLCAHLRRALNPQGAKLAKAPLGSHSQSDGSPVPNLPTRDTAAHDPAGKTHASAPTLALCTRTWPWQPPFEHQLGHLANATRNGPWRQGHSPHRNPTRADRPRTVPTLSPNTAQPTELQHPLQL